MEYQEMGTAELRRLIRERGIASGLAVSAANKETCIKLLNGEVTAADLNGGATNSAPSASVSSGGVDAGNAAAMLGQALAALMPKGNDMEEVRRVALDAVAPVRAEFEAKAAALSAPVRVVVEDRRTSETRDVGVVHKRFPVLLQMAQARDKDGFVPPIYLYGPAGTGKTTAARKLADALGLRFYYNGAIGNAYELSGYMDAGGTYRETPFYKAYSEGGVYLFDELDSSMPGAVLAFNAALANGHAAFPIGNVARHRDSVIIAAGNTCMRGDGNTAGFQRMKQDAAFRDRFTYLEWPIDETLEASIASAYGDEWGWLDMVRRMRRAAERAGIRDFEITPRATDRGLALLRAGLPMEEVTAAVVRKGLPEASWGKIANA